MINCMHKRLAALFYAGILLSNILLVLIINYFFCRSLPEDYISDKGFAKLFVIVFTGIILLSYGVSRFLVHYALKPATDVFEFQEKLLTNSIYELRSPLTTLKGTLELSLRKERNDEEYRDAIKISLQETDRAIDLLKNIRLLASSRLQPLEVFSEQVDLKMILSERMNACLPQIQAKGIRTEISAFPDIICVCDESLMRQIIGNLIDKAIKYAPAGGIIRISTSKDPQKIYLTISNSYGDNRKKEMKFFSETFRRDINILDKSIEGMEVGLYITRYIVGSLHGDVKVSITDDHFFSVTISLPIHAGNLAEKPLRV